MNMFQAFKTLLPFSIAALLTGCPAPIPFEIQSAVDFYRDINQPNSCKTLKIELPSKISGIVYQTELQVSLSFASESAYYSSFKPQITSENQVTTEFDKVKVTCTSTTGSIVFITKLFSYQYLRPVEVRFLELKP
jgi:hypothetical protein